MTSFARLLLEEELDLELRDKAHRTPLLAIFHEPVLIQNPGLLGIFAVSLIGPGANIQATDLQGRLPLHYAAIHGNLDMTKFLLRKGAKDILRDKAGKLAIHQALYMRHIDVAGVIAAAGVGVYHPNKRGKTAESLARELGVRLDMSSLGSLLRENRLKINKVGTLGSNRSSGKLGKRSAMNAE